MSDVETKWQDEREWQDAVEAASAAARHDCWPRPIPVSERLPADKERVLFFAEGTWHGGYSESLKSHDGRPFRWWWTDEAMGEEGFSESDVTHWLPIPPKPENK